MLALLIMIAGCSGPVPTEGRLFSVCETPIIFWWAESDGGLYHTTDIAEMRAVLDALDPDDADHINWCPKPREERSNV